MGKNKSYLEALSLIDELLLEEPEEEPKDEEPKSLEYLAEHDPEELLKIAKEDYTKETPIFNLLVDEGLFDLAYQVDPEYLIDHLAEYDPKLLIKLAEDNPSDQKEIISGLLGYGCYEIAYEINPNAIRKEFALEHPSGAIIHGVKVWDQELIMQGIDQLMEYSWREEVSEQVLDIYTELTKIGSYQAYEVVERIFLSIEDEISKLTHLGEIHSRALEVEDYNTLIAIAYAVIDDSPEEAIEIALETEDRKLIEKLEEQLGDLGTYMAYGQMISEASQIISAIAQHFDTELPNKIKIGGPAGSYASIKYKRFKQEECHCN